MKKLLINISNHLSEKWGEEQRRDWDLIIDLPFPTVSPYASTEDVDDLASTLEQEVKKIAETYKDFSVYVYVAGEYTLSYLLAYRIGSDFTIAIPTTERVVKESVKQDGSVEKTAIFKFVQWRYIDLKEV